MVATNNTATSAYSVSKAGANMLVAKYACTLKPETADSSKNDFVVAGIGPTLVYTLPQSEHSMFINS